MATFLSAMVLTVHFWSSRQSKAATYDLEREIADIERCRDFMTFAEKRCADLLSELHGSDIVFLGGMLQDVYGMYTVQFCRTIF